LNQNFFSLFIFQLRKFLRERFDLSEDQAAHEDIIASIARSTEFKGTNLWILMFSIIVASVGLNMNSPAVIIGAMLISPLLGPIIGIGLAVAIYDFELVKKSYKNFLIAVGISVMASTAYFFISPISDAQSELLARTSPTIYDVFIAFFGGLAGIIANTRKDKFGTVIPGVAIATALMPPLCTAGYGLATGNLYYFFGAFYLFFINSVFIALATFLIVRFLRFPVKNLVDKNREKRVQLYIILITLFTLIPSVYLGYKIVMKSVFERNAYAFIQSELTFPQAQVIDKHLYYDGEQNEIRVLLLGEYIESNIIELAQNKMPNYGLKSTELVIKQGLNNRDLPDINTLRASLLEDFYKSAEDKIKTAEEKIILLETELTKYKKYEASTADIQHEIKALDPGIDEMSIMRGLVANMDTHETDTIFMVYLNYRNGVSPVNKTKLERWARARLKTDKVRIVYD
jgi:uncharacterized hydrophobic protein (TIGR00271 family)